MLYRSNSKQSQFGIAVIETAAITFIIGFLSYLIFALAQAYSLRHELNKAVEELLHLQNKPMISVRYSSSNSAIFEEDEPIILETLEGINTHALFLLSSSSFLRARPYRLEVAIVMATMNSNSGIFNGFQQKVSKKSTGNLVVPSAIESQFSIDQMLSRASLDPTLISNLAEPSTQILFEENAQSHDRFIPKIPLKVVCLYIQDEGSLRDLFGHSTIQDGVLAQCDIKKGRVVL